MKFSHSVYTIFNADVLANTNESMEVRSNSKGRGALMISPDTTIGAPQCIPLLGYLCVPM